MQEPILPNIPRRDRVGQIRAYSRELEEVFGRRPRGMWLPERVWEQGLVSSIVEAGMEYTVLDDYHFQAAGLEADDLLGYHLTEDEGALLKVFPNSEPMRYLVPWKEPHETYVYLRELAERRPGAVVVCADDGEKFGAWPQTHDHVYARGWLRNFCEMVRANGDWLEMATFAEAVERTLPVGKVFIPDSSYREMTEWVLTPSRYRAYRAARAAVEGGADEERLRGHVRPGGFWRNFRAKYPESDEMYARMLEVSSRLAAMEDSGRFDGASLEPARQALYRGQCNCPYWHGAFGGLYLPHLRNAIYANLIEADARLDAVEGRGTGRVVASVADFNLDARQEVRLANSRLVAYVRPAQGGQLYELDDHRTRMNLLATLDRRPESYHETILATLQGRSDEGAAPSVTQQVVFKHEKLDGLLHYDRTPRKAFVDHFVGPGTTLDEWLRGEVPERGDFATGAYLGRIERGEGEVRLVLERRGYAEGRPLTLRKCYRLMGDDPGLEVRYELEGLEPGTLLRLAVECNVAGLAGKADDRYYLDDRGARLGRLDSQLELDSCRGVALCDEWLDLRAGLEWSRPAVGWCVPVETVSQSEGGFEGVYQSSAVVPCWEVRPDDAGRWEVTIRWRLEPVSAPWVPGHGEASNGARRESHRAGVGTPA
jgi:alpha-amylase